MKRIRSLLAILVLSLFRIGAAEPTTVHQAPELAFKVPGQGEVLLSHYKGQVVALEFIKTTCAHCQAASRLMTQMQRQYGSRGFQAVDVAINALDEGENEAQANLLVETFSRNFQVGFPVGWVTRDQFLRFTGFSVMELTVVPQLVIIDRRGNIRYQTPARGDEVSMKEATIRGRLEELLAEAAPAAGHSAAKRGQVARKRS